MNIDHTYAKLRNIPIFLIGRIYIIPEKHPSIHKEAYYIKFENGYTASVVKFNNNRYWYNDNFEWELAIIGPHGGIVYDTPVTSDVERGDADRIEELLQQIENLPEIK